MLPTKLRNHILAATDDEHATDPFSPFSLPYPLPVHPYPITHARPAPLPQNSPHSLHQSNFGFITRCLYTHFTYPVRYSMHHTCMVCVHERISDQRPPGACSTQPSHSTIREWRASRDHSRVATVVILLTPCMCPPWYVTPCTHQSTATQPLRLHSIVWGENKYLARYSVSPLTKRLTAYRSQ